jgi:hypothetical protein
VHGGFQGVSTIDDSITEICGFDLIRSKYITRRSIIGIID